MISRLAIFFTGNGGIRMDGVSMWLKVGKVGVQDRWEL